VLTGRHEPFQQDSVKLDGMSYIHCKRLASSSFLSRVCFPVNALAYILYSFDRLDKLNGMNMWFKGLHFSALKKFSRHRNSRGVAIRRRGHVRRELDEGGPAQQ